MFIRGPNTGSDVSLRLNLARRRFFSDGNSPLAEGAQPGCQDHIACKTMILRDLLSQHILRLFLEYKGQQKFKLFSRVFTRFSTTAYWMGQRDAKLPRNVKPSNWREYPEDNYSNKNVVKT